MSCQGLEMKSNSSEWVKSYPVWHGGGDAAEGSDVQKDPTTNISHSRIDHILIARQLAIGVVGVHVQQVHAVNHRLIGGVEFSHLPKRNLQAVLGIGGPLMIGMGT